MTTGTERELVDRAREGDLTAFEILYRRNAGRVYAICLRLTANPDQAEELTQDAFVRAWQRLGSFEGRSAFSSWLHRLTVNVVLDARRRELREPAALLAQGEPEDLPAIGGSVDLGLDLERAIATLPTRARMVYVLHEIEGYRHEEIAALTGMAEGTSKAQLHRAKARLRKALSR